MIIIIYLCQRQLFTHSYFIIFEVSVWPSTYAYYNVGMVYFLQFFKLLLWSVKVHYNQLVYVQQTEITRTVWETPYPCQCHLKVIGSRSQGGQG